MSFKNGLDTLARKGQSLAPSDRVGDFIDFWTPAAIAAYARETDSDVQAAYNDVWHWFTDLPDDSPLWVQDTTSSPGVTKRVVPLVQHWKAFYDNWKAFFADAQSSWYYSTVERCQTYRIELKAWRDEFRRAGVKFSTPDPNLTPPSSADKSAGGTLGKVAMGVAVGVGTYMLVEGLKAWKR